MAYAQPDVLRAAAKILRGWKDEEPRALWERLRAELKAGAAVEGAEGVAKWMITTGWTLGDGAKCVAPGAAPGVKPAVTIDGMIERLRTLPTWPPVTIAADGRAVTPEEVAGWCVLADQSFQKGNPDSGFKDDLACFERGTRNRPAHVGDRVADRMDGLPTWPPVTIVADGRVVTPEEVAGFILANRWSFSQRGPEHGYGGPGAACGDWPGRDEALGCVATADIVRRMGEAHAWPPVTITADARTVAPPRLPEGVIAYMDPPYLDTTGYKHDLPRSEVVKMARTWAAAGATVCISEAEPIPDLIADGWHAVEISATRKGQKRTFSKQQAEWLTLSRPPSFVPRETLDLFGGAS
jgi:hypothetical protein